jgi:RNA polymerase sigma-70 factor (ECF subfamily)
MRIHLPRDPLAQPETLIPRVYAYVAYRLGDGPDAEDVTSEVFERAVRYRKTYDRSKGEPVAWLLGIAHRCTSAALAARRPDGGEADETHDGRNLEEESVRRLTLAAAIAQLSPRDQELVAFRFGADLTATQIAQVMNAQTNTIEVALHRALGRLRTILEADESDDAPHALKASAG